MANLLAYKPSMLISGVTASFASLGIDNTVVSKIFEEPDSVNGTFKSFDPLASINSLTGFTYGKPYIIFPKVDFNIISLAFASAPSFVVTQAQYDALSPAEQASDNIYIIVA